ncbi:cyclophilin-like fold protein [Bifidobacterium eulemuris]|uniref:Cyclophilin-like domain-containing protein n=1 Tax=Bifidobacterium eulemuris TaxID=1765219 RepID=A0A261G7Y2_9BIFI|nr:cyclophilin-like fold protein [Bifidobacterium eulemuris]OZG67532.1 hypothetical protein BEUL_1623 [Bifidobacterium eulemuris]QOL31069.1 hypothetical protein BE0216_00240 [Bifidobacterium eulemuris]
MGQLNISRGVVVLRAVAAMLACAVLLLAAGCGARNESAREGGSGTDSSQSDAMQSESGDVGTQSESNTNAPTANGDTGNDDTAESERTMNDITITVNGQSFSATLADTQAARAFAERLPLTVSMDDLHGNEKYHYLDEELPTNASNPGTIHAGDLMLFGSDCLVLFYETFQTSYTYTRIASIDDAADLPDAVGGGSVTVSFAN